MAKSIDVISKTVKSRENQLKLSKKKLEDYNRKYYLLKAREASQPEIEYAVWDMMWEKARVKDLTSQVKKLKRMK